MVMSDPRESAHVAKMTPGVSGPAVEVRLAQSGGIGGRLGPESLSLCLPFSVTHWSCGASEITEGFAGKAYLREHGSA